MNLSKFGNEILSKGPEAVLPQNLSQAWLEVLQKMADQFLDCNYADIQCSSSKKLADPILIACVSEILKSQHRGKVKVSDEEMIRLIAHYAVEVTVESAGRNNSTGLEPPTLENILSRERWGYLKKANHKLGRLLAKFGIS